MFGLKKKEESKALLDHAAPVGSEYGTKAGQADPKAGSSGHPVPKKAPSESGVPVTTDQQKTKSKDELNKDEKVVGSKEIFSAGEKWMVMLVQFT